MAAWEADERAPYHPLIANVWHGRGNAPREIAEANAHLIAAAPELLEALESVPLFGENMYTEVKEWFEKISSNAFAIAKTKGESKS